MCGGEPEGWRSGCWVKARKPRECYACAETIRPGDIYHREVGAEPGESIFRYDHCARCWRILCFLVDDGAEGVPYALNCGEDFEYFEANDDPYRKANDDHWAHTLAFQTPEEAQTFALEQRAKERRHLERIREASKPPEEPVR